MRGSLFAAALAGLAFSFGASAATINVCVDNFDGYANQAAFEGVWTPIGTVAPTSAELSSARYVSASNSVRLPGTGTNSQYRNRRTFTDTTAPTGGTQQLLWSFDFYDSASGSNPYRNYCNLQDTTAPTGTNQLIAMGLNNNQLSSGSGGNYYMARILGYTPTAVDPDGGSNETGTLSSGMYFKLNDFGVGLRSTGWHNLKVLITASGSAQSYAFYVDGQLAEKVSGIGTVLRGYDNIAIGSGVSNSSIESNVDNMTFQVVDVPEPASLALLGLSGLLLRRRR